MKTFLLLALIIPTMSWALIEDNSFLLEEAYNQEWGVYQFIQSYRTFERSRGTQYAFGNEIPITDKVHQFSYNFTRSEQNQVNPKGAMGDTTLNYRWQPFNKDGVMVAERFGVIVPTGSVGKGTGRGVYGFTFMQAATIAMSDKWMNHWNMGFTIMPGAESAGLSKERTLTSTSAGTSIVYLASDNFNFLIEALLESSQDINEDGDTEAETFLTINPGVRFAVDWDWYDSQIVPGISFPTEVLNSETEHGVLLYLSVEPKFY